MPDAGYQDGASWHYKVTQNIGATPELRGPFLEFGSGCPYARIIGNFVCSLQDNKGGSSSSGGTSWSKEVVEPGVLLVQRNCKAALPPA
jgi:hypothetical protein